MAFRYVFVPGVNEGLFPRPPAEDPLLLEAQRASLGVELRAEDTELLRIAAACASEQFTLSFSRLDLLTGRERVPSFYAFAVASRGRRAGDRRARIRSARPLRHAHAHRLAGAARSRRRHRRRGIRPRHAGPARQGFGRVSEASAGPRRGVAARALVALAQAVEAGRRPVRRGDRQRCARSHTGLPRAPGRLRCCSSMHAAPTASRCAAFSACAPRSGPTGIQRMDPANRGRSLSRRAVRPAARSDGGGLLPVTERTLRRRAGTARCHPASRRRSATEAELAPAIPQIWRAEVQSIRADLRGWLQQKALLGRRLDARIQRTELRSHKPGGPRSAQPARSPSPSAAATSCKAPSIWWSGTRAVRCAWWITRPAAFRTRGRRSWARGEVLQPMLYALAAEEMLGEPVALGRLYYSTIAQNYTPIDVPLHDWTRRRAQHVLNYRQGDRAMAPCPPRRARMAARTANTCPSAVPTKKSASRKNRRPN